LQTQRHSLSINFSHTVQKHNNQRLHRKNGYEN
jgi:hypothetical protein